MFCRCSTDPRTTPRRSSNFALNCAPARLRYATMVAVRTALIVVRIHDTRAGEAFIGAELGFFEDARAAQRCLTRNPESDNAMRAQVLAIRLATLAIFT